MDWKHLLIGFVLFFVGYVVAKKYPSLFSSIPGVSAITG